MGTQSLTTLAARLDKGEDRGHKLRWNLAAPASRATVLAFQVFGHAYYTAPVVDRVRISLHQLLRGGVAPQYGNRDCVKSGYIRLSEER